jgi:long-chain acyl-CoA synthetase
MQVEKVRDSLKCTVTFGEYKWKTF